MLPDEEIDILTLAARQAMTLAREGHVADGYTALLTGFERAQEIEGEGEAWGEALVEQWRRVCLNYARQYGVKLK